MTTKLSQRRVKSGDPAYQTLRDEMQSRVWGQGTDYVMPVGGIPRIDMTTDVQDALTKAEQSYVVGANGILITELEQTAQDGIAKGLTAYQKPTDGIPLSDLEPSVQERILDFSNFYVYPETGIPFVDFDTHVRSLLTKADTAYQKPIDGIGMIDLHAEVISVLDLATSAYQLKATGIEWEELSQSVHDRIKVISDEAVMDASIIRDHSELLNIGSYTHTEIDRSIDSLNLFIHDVHSEIVKARAGFHDIDRRISSSLFRSNEFLIEGDAFNSGHFDHLVLSDDHNITFDYIPDPFPLKMYNMETSTGYEDGNHLTTIHANSLDLFWEKEIFTHNGDPQSLGVGVLIDGFLYAPTTGEYIFSLTASGSFSLTVNETSADASFRVHDPYGIDNHAYTMRVHLTGGQFYRLLLHGKNEVAQNSYLYLRWKRPDRSSFEVLKNEFFSTEGFDGQQSGIYTTDVLDSETIDIKQWRLELTTDKKWYANDVTAEIRKSSDNVTYSVWEPVTIGLDYTEAPERYFQFRITMSRTLLNKSPVIEQIRFSYLSSNNRFIREIEEARGSFVTLQDHLSDLRSTIDSTADLVSAIDQSNINTDWLENVRFEHLDLNMLRLHWYQLQETKTKPHILPSGFIDDYHDDSLVDPNFSKFEVAESKLRPYPHRFIFEKDEDWLSFNRLNTAPKDDSLQLTYLLEDTATPMTRETVVSMINANHIPQYQVAYTDSFTHVQPFYLEQNMYRISQIKVRIPGARYYSYGWQNYHNMSYLYLVPSDSEGNPDHSNQIPLGNHYGYNETGSVITINGDWKIPYTSGRYVKDNRMKCFLKVYTPKYTTSTKHYGYIPYYSGGTLESMAEHFNADPDENMSVIKDNSVLDGKYLSMNVECIPSYYIQGEADQILDTGEISTFSTAELDAAYTGSVYEGEIEIYYSSSIDGVVFSAPTTQLGEVPDGRYLKVNIRIARSSTSETPKVHRLAIRYFPYDVILQTKSVEVDRIPTHVLLDIIDSGNNDFEYEVSRNGGLNFIPVTPGIQEDIRSVPAGREMVVRVSADKTIQNDERWIDYIGLQTITHENFSTSNIVSLHNEQKASAGQTVFNLPKPYFMGDNSLEVYVNGALQSVGSSYQETNETTITFHEPLYGGEIVVFRVAAGAYSFKIDDTEGTLLSSIQDLNNRVTAVEIDVTSLQDTDLVHTHRLDGHDTTLASHKSILDDHKLRLDGHDTKNAEQDARLDGHDLTNADYETRISANETTLVTHQVTIDSHSAEIEEAQQDIITLDASLTTVSQNLATLKQEHGDRLLSLETADANFRAEIDGIYQSIASIEQNLEEVNLLMSITKEQYEQMLLDIQSNADGISQINVTLGLIDQRLVSIDDSLLAIRDRVGRIETNQLNLSVSQLSFKDIDEDQTKTGIQISENITLPDSDVNGAWITWESLSPDWITSTGLVTQPSYTLGDQDAVLKATVDYADQTKMKEFMLTILAADPTSEEKVAEDKLYVSLADIDENPDVSGIQVTQNITFDYVGEIHGTQISWTSSNTAVITNDGIVTRPAYNDTNRNVTLTATLQDGTVVDTKSFTVTVLKKDPTDSEMVLEDKNALTMDHFDEEPLITGIQRYNDMVLQATGDLYGSTITWMSSNTVYITHDGLVTRPTFEEGDQVITMTSTITNGEATDTKSFDIIVVALPEDPKMTSSTYDGQVEGETQEFTALRPASHYLMRQADLEQRLIRQAHSLVSLSLEMLQRTKLFFQERSNLLSVKQLRQRFKEVI